MKKFAKITAVALVVVMVMALLVACAPASDPDKAVAALKKHEYSNATNSKLVLGTVLTALGVKNVNTVVTASKTVEKDGSKKLEKVTIVYFTSASAANEAWTELQKYGSDQKEKDSNSDWVCQKSGAMIYWGTKNAINAAH